MAGRDYLELGSWNALCSMCGRKRKASELVKNWQGMYRCPEHNEARHPQDFVRAVPDVQTPPWVQPQPDFLLLFGVFIVTEASDLSVLTPDWNVILTETSYPITTED